MKNRYHPEIVPKKTEEPTRKTLQTSQSKG